LHVNIQVKKIKYAYIDEESIIGITTLDFGYPQWNKNYKNIKNYDESKLKQNCIDLEVKIIIIILQKKSKRGKY
jgi:hypothetical protein